MNRRALLSAIAGWAAAPLLGAAHQTPDADRVRARLAALEARSGGRLGVAVVDTAHPRSPNGAAPIVSYRGGERFPYCSSNKTSLAGAVLRRVDRGTEQLDRRLAVPAATLHYSPFTAQHAGGTMTVRALLAAMLTVSDNTAFNVLVASIGGLPALRADAAALGDTTMRADRIEPDLNSALPGDARDTTTPIAAAGHLAQLIAGDGLRPPTRALLIGWMRAASTGRDRLRASAPSTWIAGDKTGTGDRGATADVAFFYRPGIAKPLIVASYYTEGEGPQSRRNAVLASAARIVL